MQLFQICGNFCSSWIPFSPSLKQLQFLPIPSTRQKTWFSCWLQRAVRAPNGWALPLFSQEAGFPSFAQRWFSLLSQESKPLVKLVQNSQIKSDVRRDWEHGRKSIKQRKGRWSTWITYSSPHHTQLFYYATLLTLDKNPRVPLCSTQISAACSC